MRSFGLRILIGVICCLNFSTILASPAKLNVQRAAFLQAEYALNHNQRIEFLILSNSLRLYSLYPYLIYEKLNQNIKLDSEKDIEDFLQRYADTPLANKLRDNWLTFLVKEKRWSLFIRNYKPTSNIESQCSYLQALIETKNENAATQLMQKLWQSGATLPVPCEAAFTAWYKTGKLTPELIWARARLAIANNDQSLLMKLENWSLPAQQAQLNLWQKIVKDPSLVAQSNLYNPQNANDKEILIDGFSRWAKKDPQDLSNVWSKLKNNYQFTEAEQQDIQKKLAIALARDNDPNAASWLASVKPIYADQRLREWRIRTALAKGNWTQVKYWITQLTPTEQAANIWQYWLARAYSNLYQPCLAKQIYTGLAKKVDFYGFLASQQLHQTYLPNNTPLKVDADTFSKVKSLPAIQRATELYALQRVSDARREWLWATNKMNQQELLAAAQLAFQLKWYDRVIANAAKAGDWNNLQLRFPLAYPAEIKAVSRSVGVNPAWTYGIMRQESNFMNDAKSVVGALGLMQCMPSTANILAKTNISELEVLNTKTNILLGTRYLKQLSNWYKGNILMATAAYNIGPTRLKKWLPLYKKVPKDVWVDLLPWQETRDYIKAVLLNTVIYQQKLAH